MRWPWVSREVVAAKDELIAHLQEEIRLLRANPVPMNVHLDIPEGLIVTQPAVMRRVRKTDEEQAPEQKPIDYANLDENDEQTLARLAFRELGPNFRNKWVLRQFLTSVRSQIRAAKAAKLRPPEPFETVEKQEMPDEIKRMIQLADAGDAAALSESLEKR